MTPRRVAVTGLGAISALGLDRDAFWGGLCGGRCGIGPIHTIPTHRLSTTIAAQVSGYDAAAHFEPRQAALLDRVSQFAVVAGRQAVAQAGLDVAQIAAMGGRAGVILGAASGQTTMDDCYLALYGQGVNRMHPFTVPRIMPNGPASALSIAFGARGACFAVASACASSTHAIGQAFDMIRANRLDLCLTGGADASITVGVIKAWEGLRVLSADTCRPFSRDRSGLVLGEGAGVLVLEAWDHAAARGATVMAEIVGIGMTADAADLTAPDQQGAAGAMQAALDDAGLAPSVIGYVNAHGTGTKLNDRIETAALGRVFGDSLPPVSSTKSQIGHCLNAAGGLEAVATVLALGAQILPPTVNYRAPDPDCVADCVANAARPATFEYAMSNSFAFGGLNAVLALRRA